MKQSKNTNFPKTSYKQQKQKNKRRKKRDREKGEFSSGCVCERKHNWEGAEKGGGSCYTRPSDELRLKRSSKLTRNSTSVIKDTPTFVVLKSQLRTLAGVTFLLRNPHVVLPIQYERQECNQLTSLSSSLLQFLFFIGFLVLIRHKSLIPNTS